MTPITHTQTAQLQHILTELPASKVQELFDFALYLHQQYAPASRRGTAETILHTLDTVGPLQFEVGELDELLLEIEQMRQMDVAPHG
jgi:hypothetical protein